MKSCCSPPALDRQENLPANINLNGCCGCVETLHEIGRWADSVAEIGRPYFGEFADRLLRVRDQISQGCQNPKCRCDVCLCNVCECEDDESNGRDAAGGDPAAAQRRKVVVLTQLDEMVGRLRCEAECFDSWQAAIRAFHRICSLLGIVMADRHKL